MLLIYSTPQTPQEAQTQLDSLTVEAVEVMHPTNRRRLYQKRNKINTYYDRILLISNTYANKGVQGWDVVATRAREDRKILMAVKEGLQDEAIQIY